jgi:hypothetical protein
LTIRKEKESHAEVAKAYDKKESFTHEIVKKEKFIPILWS